MYLNYLSYVLPDRHFYGKFLFVFLPKLWSYMVKIVFFILGPFVNYIIRIWGFHVGAQFGGLLLCLGYVGSYYVNDIYYLYITYGLIAGTHIYKLNYCLTNKLN